MSKHKGPKITKEKKGVVPSPAELERIHSLGKKAMKKPRFKKKSFGVG